MRYADADLRKHELPADPYTIHRIQDQSYERIAELLARCSDVGHEAALDVGCGAGFDTFALAGEFDRIIAIEVQRRPLRTARRIAREHQLGRISFRRQDALRPASGGPFDFIYCNGMSHYTPQRARLVETLVQSAKPGGWIFIGEETEGYAPLEIENAIRDQDSRSLRARLRQILNGILGLPEFMFFVSGNLEPLLFACGAEATWSDTTEWMGLPYFQRTLARRANQTMVAAAIQGDYTELPGEIGRLQEICKPVLGRPPPRDQRLQLSDFAEPEA